MALTRRHPVRDQTVLIVGASQGIGRAAALELARRGASLGLVARQPAALGEAREALLPLLTRPGQFVEPIAADATDAATLGPLIDDFVARRGPPQVLVNNVGRAQPGRVTALSAADYRAAFEANVIGQVVPFHALLPHLLRAGGGHVVNVASMLGYFSIMGYASYAPTKFALVGWTETLRNELKPQGLSFGLLYPPDTLTPGYAQENLGKPPECREMSAGARAMTPEAVALALVEGIERRRQHILPGDAAWVWRLKRFAPALLDALLDRSHARARRRLDQLREPAC